MNILLAIETLDTGGAENFVKHLAVALAKSNRVHMLLTSPDVENKGLKLPGVQIIYPLRLRWVEALLWKPYWRYRLSHWVQRFQFKYVIWKLNISIIHSHLFVTDFKIYKWLSNKKFPWIIGMHGCYEAYLFRGHNNGKNDRTVNAMYHKRMEAILSRVNFVAMASEKNAEVFDFVKARPQTELVNYGFPDSEPPTRASKTGSSTWIIGMVSRGILTKGWEVGIQGFLKFMETVGRGKAILKLIYSESPYMDSVKEKYKNEGDVHFVGHKSDVLPEMAAMDILLFPSYFPSESQPVTIIEAMKSGLPVIGTTIGEIPRMLNIENKSSGVCLALRDDGKPHTEDIKNALLAMTSDLKAYAVLVDNCRNNFQPFSMSNCVEKYKKLYTSLSHKH